MTDIRLVKTKCPVCGSLSLKALIYSINFRVGLPDGLDTDFRCDACAHYPVETVDYEASSEDLCRRWTGPSS